MKTKTNVTSKEKQVADPNERFSVPKRADVFDVGDGVWRGHIIDYFFEKYNHENGYEGLNLGDYVTIGAYDWMVAGFDYFQDIYGPGIVFIPKINVGAMIMNTTNVSFGGYSNSFMNSTLKLMLEDMRFARIQDHIVKDHDGNPYIRLMSDIQVYGKTIDFGREEDEWAYVAYERSVADHSQILPIFNYISPFEYSDDVPKDRSWLNPDPKGFWLSTVVSTASYAYATADNKCGIDWDYPSVSHGLRPLMYLNRFV